MTSGAPAATTNVVEARAFTLRQRFLIWLISWVGYLAIRLIGPTLRFTVSIEEGGPEDEFFRPAVYVFWHCCVFPNTWHFRQRDIAVMTSRSYDGEYIARIIERFGFRAVRGSSSRGAVRALLGMHTEIEQGRSVAFTIDGPRGPRFVAKPGPVLLARNTAVPLIAFHVALDRSWVLNTWDRFMIPRPFSRAYMRVSRQMFVPRETDSAGVQQFHEEMQAALDRVRQYAEAKLAKKY